MKPVTIRSNSFLFTITYEDLRVWLDWSPSHLRTWMVEQGLVFKEEEIALFEGLCSLNRISGLFCLVKQRSHVK